MHLLLFDIDGTLLDSSRDDDRLFRAALREALPDDVADREAGPWEAYPEVTHPAIVRALVKQRRGRAATEDEVARVGEAYTAQWRHAVAAGEVTLRPRTGAVALMRAALAREDFAVAIATGSWTAPATWKLHTAGFPTADLVLASADDAEERAVILRTAAIFAAAARGAPGFGASVVIGDGVWDARAARAVRAGFVGVHPEPAAAARLQAEGAVVVLPHFEPPEAFWSAVQAALQARRGARAN